MSCTTCNRAKPLPTCITNLTIGTLAADTDYYVYIKRLSNGTLKRVSAISDSEGLLIADISDLDEFLSPGSDFELWVTLQSAENINDREVISIGATDSECLLLTFEAIKVAANIYNAFPGISEQTIVLL
jgi:hypothetical protein